MSEEEKPIEVAEVLEFVRSRGGPVTFAELSMHFGERALGDLCFAVGPPDTNIIIWDGMSESLIEALGSKAFELAAEYVLVCRGCYRGMGLDLPIVGGRPKKGRFKDPHWLPMAISLRAGTVQ